MTDRQTAVPAGHRAAPAADPRPTWRSSRPASTAAPNIWSYEQGDPPRRRPRRPRGLPDQHACPGSPTTCSSCFPASREHSCSRGRRGGFVERLTRGHLARARRRARRAAAAAGGRPRHPARQDPAGQGRARAATTSIYGYVDEQVGLAAGAARRPARQPPGRGRPGLRLRRRARALHRCAPSAPRSARRPRRSSTRRCPATSRGSGSTSTPWSSSARASTRSGSGPR